MILCVADGKIEEGRKITDVAREFDIAHSVVSRLWKSFKTTGMYSRRHERGLPPAEDRSSYQQKGTGAPQLWWQMFLAASGINIQRKTCSHTNTSRLQWCREHHNWTEQEWACVLFSDFQSVIDRCQLIRRESRSQVAGRNSPPTNKNTLIRALTEEWDKLPQQLLDNVVQRPWVAWWLEHRTPDRKSWVRCPMPPNTPRVHTKYVLVKSVGSKVLWAESRVQGTGEYFPPLQTHDKIVEVVSPSIIPSSNFTELIRTVTLYGAQGLGQRQAYF
ncbi:uncharacterized protein TNCV_701011 [Trichonephila clavipes]|nr:uncharacterized protein TNCV_701011 [Trichonephila clavipes]